ncbi:MAG: alpha-N-arabinofuranosidase, partial [Oscillospiraceae bacterium]|nr:alpha-N-arabinofuranosidase [Oscillospiraceae bacterium]
KGKGEYPAYIACNLFSKTEQYNQTHNEAWVDGRFPKITQDGKDGDEEPGYISNMRDGAIAGFKYFDIKDLKKISIKTRAYANGCMEIKTSWDGKALASIPIKSSTIWMNRTTNISIPDGTQSLYFEFKGTGGVSLASFTLE